MADTLQSVVQLTYTPSAVSNTVQNPVYYTNTTAPTQQISGYLSVPSGSTLTVSLSQFATSVMTLFIDNLDATNYVTVTFKPTGQGSTTGIQVNAGQSLLLGGGLVLASNVVLQANSAAVQCFYLIAGT